MKEFSVLDFGAVPDNHTDCTEAFNRACVAAKAASEDELKEGEQ